MTARTTSQSAGSRHPDGGAARYCGRFAPSPTGPLHAGSLATALASWLDARAHGGRWLVRIEDVDTSRSVPGTDAIILAQLAACGLVPDEAPARQSARTRVYARAADRLLRSGWAYPCGCTRADITQALARQDVFRPRHGELIYPGTCRSGLHGKPARALRVLTSDAAAPDARLRIDWHDRRLGAQCQDVSHQIGDFVLLRADGLWAYQLAVVVDDADFGVTHVVRGEDLDDNTPRQIHLQRLLGLPTPSYLHTPLVLGADGQKLSKQNCARPIDVGDPFGALDAAARALGLEVEPATRNGDLPTWLGDATVRWGTRWLV